MTIAVRADLKMGKFSFSCEEGSILAGIGKERALRDIEVWNGKDI